MKVLIISQYFWPENFKINDIALGLKEEGHDVIVLTGQPNYPDGSIYSNYKNRKCIEYWNGIKIYRSILIPRGNGGGVRLLLNYMSFAVFGSFRVFNIKEKIDCTLVFEPSPITVGFPAMIYKMIRKVPYAFWVQDLWPASLTAAGGVNNKLVLGFFNWLTKEIYKYSSILLVQSRTFSDYILKQGVKEDKIIYLPNTTEIFYKRINYTDKYDSVVPKGKNILFAGNIGEAQSLDTFLEAMKIVIDKGMEFNWIIVGDGRYKESLKEKVNKLSLSEYVYFVGKFPSEEMPYFFSYADALYVSLKKDYIFSLTIPSKVQSYLACGRPILASLDGEGAKVVKEAKAGFISDSENVEELVINIEKIIMLSTEEKNMMGQNALDYFNKEFKRSVVLERLIRVLNNIIK
ncbi:glycosyltransferase family 4 protein [Myroides odoratimimus]|uniref:glycosyltransferase family 4 protein n=1 Tax=Myroides odoratimimus TaxID=76832 RepID=UPI0025768979|nr:glycosyltransferase family 4 protein [Myroides odoratimimus]MDM1398171.1 glycosyltransferase family 4 protein [Myroides odoratimimus]